ncbi:hypothetical protein HDU67_002778, partial [Dinochytrium kinnereticum]
MWPLPPQDVDMKTILVGIYILPVNQAYFMGLFFALSGYFVTQSYNRKGPGEFMRDRALRLLVPIPIYELVLAPALLLAVVYPAPVAKVIQSYFKSYKFLNNPLWFIMLLFVFDLTYVLFRIAFPRVNLMLSSKPTSVVSFTMTRTITFAAASTAFLAITTFVVRIATPVGFWVPIAGQVAYLPQYIFAYIAGNAAYRYNFFDRIHSPACLWGGLLAALLSFALFAIEEKHLFGLEIVQGGLRWTSALFTGVEMT